MPSGRIPRKKEIEVRGSAYGDTDKFTLHFKDSTLGEKEFTDNLMSFNVEDRLNQIVSISLTMFALSSSDKNYVKEGNTFKLFYDTKLVAKGMVDKITFDSYEGALIDAYGMEILVSRQKTDRTTYQYTNTNTDTIVSALIDSISSITEGTNTNYGAVSIRYENINRLRGVAELCKNIEYDWWVSYSSDDNYETNYFNVDSTRGSGSSVYTFNISGASQNINNSEKKKDDSHLVTKATLLGYGDGVNQLASTNYHATDNRTTLNDAGGFVSATDTTITVTDASSLPASGNVWIGAEKVAYSGKSGNDLTGCTRASAWGGGVQPSGWVTNTTGYRHNNGIEVWDAQYTETASETGSSIDTYGLYEFKDSDRSILSQDFLDRATQRIISRQKVPVERIMIDPTDFGAILKNPVNVGDTVTVTDADAGLSGDYIVVGKIVKSEQGYETMSIELSNTPIGILDDMENTATKEEQTSRYAQGATNIYAISETENCDASVDLNMRFYLPSEAIAVNKVLLSFKLKDYRSYTNTSQTAAADAGHTHGIVVKDQGGATNVEIVGNILSAATGAGDATVWSSASAFTSHTHAITMGFGINEEALATPSVDVSVGAEGSETSIDTYTSDQEDVDITDAVKAVGPGNWINIKFEANKRMRIEANCYCQIFIESK
jgi:hypothetical protein